MIQQTDFYRYKKWMLNGGISAYIDLDIELTVEEGHSLLFGLWKSLNKKEREKYLRLYS